MQIKNNNNSNKNSKLGDIKNQEHRNYINKLDLRIN